MKVTVLVMCLIPHSDCAMPQRVTYKLSIMVAQLPARSSTAVIGRPLPTSLRCRFSAASQVRQSTTPVLPRHRLQTYGRWAFSVAGQSAWNSLPDNLRDSNVSRDSFRKLLKTQLRGIHGHRITSNRNCCSAHEEVPCYRYTCLSLE